MNSLFMGIDPTDKITNAKIEKLRAERAKTEQQLADAERELEQLEHKIARMKNSLSVAGRKARTRRLVQCGAIAESFVPDADNHTNDEFKAILQHKFVDGVVISPNGENPQARATTGLA
jgi:predicted  nucleic acid-binding Zn-ribbon protein